ncbi:unnamed protein product [Arctogadus glacialis]
MTAAVEAPVPELWSQRAGRFCYSSAATRSPPLPGHLHYQDLRSSGEGLAWGRPPGLPPPPPLVAEEVFQIQSVQWIHFIGSKKRSSSVCLAKDRNLAALKQVLLTASPLLLTASPLLLAASPLLLTASPLLLTASPLLLTASPLLLTASPLLLTASPLLLAASPLLLTASPLLLAPSPLLLTASPLLLAPSPSPLPSPREAAINTRAGVHVVGKTCRK